MDRDGRAVAGVQDAMDRDRRDRERLAGAELARAGDPAERQPVLANVPDTTVIAAPDSSWSWNPVS